MTYTGLTPLTRAAELLTIPDFTRRDIWLRTDDGDEVLVTNAHRVGDSIAVTADSPGWPAPGGNVRTFYLSPNARISTRVY